MFGEHPLDNEDYGHIVNAKHFARVRELIDPDKVVLGGTARESSLKIEPTILDGVAPEDAVMQEIFGPILPVLTFESLDEAETFITDRPTPLALYIFSQDRAVQQRFLCVTCPLVAAASTTPSCTWLRATWALAWARAAWGSTMAAQASIRLATRRAS